VYVLFAYKSDIANDAKQLFEEILKSIRCHSQNGWNHWGLFNFSFRIPDDFQLKKKKIEAGYLSLELYKQETHLSNSNRHEVSIEYWSAATVNFKETYRSPYEWFQKNYTQKFKKRFKNLELNQKEFEICKIGGHKAMSIKSTNKKLGLRQLSMQCNIFTWYCHFTNRVYVLTLFNLVNSLRSYKAKATRNLFDQILSSITCH
jgi:hypothetical protein